jgi:hypothetical protein
MRLKYIFFFYSLEASFFSQIVKKAESVSKSINLLNSSKLIFSNVFSKSFQYLKTHKKGLITFPGFSLLIFLIKSSKRGSDILLKIQRHPIIETCQEYQSEISLSIFMFLILYQISSKIGSSLNDKSLKKLEILDKLLITGNINTYSRIFCHFSRVVLFFNHYAVISAILLKLIILGIAFCSSPSYFIHILVKPCIIYFIIWSIYKNKFLSVKMLQYLLIAGTSLGIANFISLILFLSLKILIPFP